MGTSTLSSWGTLWAHRGGGSGALLGPRTCEATDGFEQVHKERGLHSSWSNWGPLGNDGQALGIYSKEEGQIQSFGDPFTGAHSGLPGLPSLVGAPWSMAPTYPHKKRGGGQV